MALSGIQIYKLLPQTNCKDCDYPTCLAFAMKLAAKQAELEACPHVTEEGKAKLSEAAAPPVRPIKVSSNGHEILAGNETVLFRHEKTFYNKPGIFLRVRDTEPADQIQKKVQEAAAYTVDYVGIDLSLDGFVVQAAGGDFVAAVDAVRASSDLPLLLMGEPQAIEPALAQLREGEHTLIGLADQGNWEAFAGLARENGAALALTAGTLDEMVTLVEQVTAAGVKDIVLHPAQAGMRGVLHASTLIRRMALKKSFRPLGFPILIIPGDRQDPRWEAMLAAQAIGKYGGFIFIDHFSPEVAYPLLVLRENVYTDPQKPIQVQPGLYEINSPAPEDPVLVTTNFSITYFSVANEVESVGLPAWLLVTESEGMSVLTAWAAGKFDAERIAKDVKRFEVEEKVANRVLVIPGHVAVLSGELEEELPDWQIRVGPREAVDLPSFMKEAL